jgi:uncharacterized protein YdaU (DUF1376 family)
MSSWFPFFGRDFLTATSGWTAEERGHYITLLIVQWEQKAVVDDLARLELVSPGVTRCWGVVSEKFPVCSDGRRRNTRLEHERSKSHERSERARQSASSRWAKDASASGDYQSPDGAADANAMRTHMPEQCERICDGNAPMSMSMKGTSSSAHASVVDESWPALRKAWNAGVGVKWRSSRPSNTVTAALAEPAWLSLAIQAIEHLPKCLYFDDPVTLNQFCKPGFVDEVLGGKWNNRKRRKDSGRDFGDAPPPPRAFSGPEAEAFERTRRKLAAAKEGL